MRVLLDEMYRDKLAQLLRDRGIEAISVLELGLAGRSDAEVFAAAVSGGYAVLTENVSDFAALCADHTSSGSHHPGVLIALSSRFSRRPSGYAAIADAVVAVEAVEPGALDDRLLHLTQGTIAPIC